MAMDPETVIVDRQHLFRYWNRYMVAVEVCLQDNTPSNRDELRSAKCKLEQIFTEIDRLLSVGEDPAKKLLRSMKGKRNG